MISKVDIYVCIGGLMNVLFNLLIFTFWNIYILDIVFSYDVIYIN